MILCLLSGYLLSCREDLLYPADERMNPAKTGRREIRHGAAAKNATVRQIPLLRSPGLSQTGTGKNTLSSLVFV
jgi:hypothetical protein